MSNNQYSLAVKPVAPVVKLDRANRKEAERQANVIARIATVTRVALDEMTTNYVVAENLAATALTNSHMIQSTTPQTPASEAYHNTLTRQYLQSLVNVASTSNEIISDRVRNLHK